MISALINGSSELTVDMANHTALSAAPQLTHNAIIRSIVLAVMSVLSVVGNCWTIVNIQESRVAKKLSHQNCTAIYRLITHLSMADLLVTCSCMIVDSVWLITVQWLAGGFMCKAIKFLQMFSLYLSTYILVLIGVDRFMAVKYPMKIINMGERIRNGLICAYSLSFIFSIPQMFIFRVQLGPFASRFEQCVTHGFYHVRWHEQLYTVLTLILMFAIPLVILFTSYLLTFRTIAYSEKKLFPPESPQATVAKDSPRTLEQVGMMVKRSYANRQKLLQRAKYKSVKMSILIILGFVLCWTPYYLMMVIFMFSDIQDEQVEQLSSWIFFFGMSNSLLNPLIYGLFHLMPKRRQFFNSFQSSQTRTGIAVGDVSHNLIASNKKIITRIGRV